MPGRSFPPIPERSLQCDSKALTNVPLLRPAPRVNRNPRRFVYHDQILVFEQDGERDLLPGRDRSLPAVFGALEPRATRGRLLEPCARARGAAPFQPLRDPGETKRLNLRDRENSGAVLARKRVQPRAGIHWRDTEFAAVSLCH